MNIHQAAEFTSLLLSVPTILFGFAVVYIWGPKAWACIRNQEPLTQTQWFIAGVSIGFVGQCLDNFYWTIPWTAHFLGMDAAKELVQIGVYFNIPSRQLCGAFAAYCHIRSAVKAKTVNLLLLASLIGMLVYGTMLVLLMGTYNKG